MTILSPRLKQLLEEIENNRDLAIQLFWEEMKKVHTPIYETVDHKQLITFIIKKEDDHEKYTVISSVSGYDLKENVFLLLPNTDIYYKSFFIEPKSRTTYYFGVNLPDDFDTFWQHRDEYLKQCFVDPFNPKQFIWPKNEEHGEDEFITSIIECPGCETQIGLEYDSSIPQGTLIRKSITSHILNNKRSIWIYTPPGYDEFKTYPFLVMVDGFEYTHVTNTPALLDHLIHEDKIPPIVALFIGNATPNSRDVELTCNEAFMKFVVEELLPQIKKEYSVTTSNHQTIIGGASFGGLCASYMALHHSEIFGNVLSQSGAYWWEAYDVVLRYKDKDKLPIKFYLDIGKLENPDTMIQRNEQFRDLLIEKGYKVTYHMFIGGHDHLCWRGTLFKGLIALIGK